MQQKSVAPRHGGISLLQFQNYINLFVQQYAISLTLYKKNKKRQQTATKTIWVW